MPAINFFCPCCGLKPVYSIELSEAVLDIVINYFKISRELVFKNWLHYDNGEARARAFTLYFIRRITGENYKMIGELFKLSGPRAGNIVKRLEDSLEIRETYQNQERDIESLVRDSKIILNLLTKSNL